MPAARVLSSPPGGGSSEADTEADDASKPKPILSRGNSKAKLSRSNSVTFDRDPPPPTATPQLSREGSLNNVNKRPVSFTPGDRSPRSMSKEEMGVAGFSGRPNAQLRTLLMPRLMAQGARLRAERLEREKQADKELSERVSRSIVQKMEEAHKAARKRWSTSEEIWELLLIVSNARLEFLAWSLLLFGILCRLDHGVGCSRGRISSRRRCRRRRVVVVAGPPFRGRAQTRRSRRMRLQSSSRAYPPSITQSLATRWRTRLLRR